MHFLLLTVSLSCLLMLSAAGVSRMRMKNPGHDDEAAAIKLQAEHQLHEKWTLFKSEHGKAYADEDEEASRKKIFAGNLKIIEEHNELYRQGKTTFTTGVNHFTDLTHSEWREIVSCGDIPLNDVPYPSEEDFHLPGVDPSVKHSVLPDAVDWRSKGIVTPVKNQGQCGSCWAFSSVGALESQMALRKDKKVRLSEQNLVDCSRRNKGCNGGIMHEAFQDIIGLGGIDTEDSYQYEAMNGTCRYHRKNNGATISDYLILPVSNEVLLKLTLAITGPLSIGVATNSTLLMSYKSGIFRDPNYCTKTQTIDHAVLLVGYNTNSPGNDYWIIKNSWGTGWGMDGYVLWPRNENNYCGVGKYSTFPIV